MAEVVDATSTSTAELLASGRRHLAVRDYNAAAEALASACEQLAKEHGEAADQCAEAYLWYGKALLGLSREESGVLGDGVPGAGNADEGAGEDDEEENDEQEENDKTEENGKAETNGDAAKNGHAEKNEPESTTDDAEPKTNGEPQTNGENGDEAAADEPGTSNGEVDDSAVDMENEDDVDNLQLAWEMLELSRSIFQKRSDASAGDTRARASLADVHLALGEVALESETYDKAVVDMLCCLELQKELFRSDDRRIAETHYQIGLANSLASNFEDAITHFKNAANILESRIKTLENPATASEDAAVKKHSANDPSYSVESEIKELKELLPEIREKIQDMMDYKAETIKRVRETLSSSNGDGPSSSSFSNGAGSSASTDKPKPAAQNISHLIKRKRKSSESGEAEATAAKKPST